MVGVATCPSCGGRAYVKDGPEVRYIDLPVCGTPMRVRLRKHRMRCSNAVCERGTWVL